MQMSEMCSLFISHGILQIHIRQIKSVIEDNLEIQLWTASITAHTRFKLIAFQCICIS